MTKKKMCVNNVRIDINIMFGVLSIKIGDQDESDFEAGVVIRINKGKCVMANGKYCGL